MTIYTVTYDHNGLTYERTFRTRDLAWKFRDQYLGIYRFHQHGCSFITETNI